VAECKPVEDFAWPPDFGFDGEGVNAYATLGRKDGKAQPLVRVSAEMMTKVIQGDPDRLAFIVGHELGHVLLRHVVANDKRDRTPFLKNTFTRDEEVAADLRGVELMGKAGYSYRKGLRAIDRMKELKLDYTSFEGLGKDHPSWDDRLAGVDKDQ